jgi:hypothetical protein
VENEGVSHMFVFEWFKTFRERERDLRTLKIPRPGQLSTSQELEAFASL